MKRKKTEVKPVARIVIASASEANRAQLSRLLSSYGLAVFRMCGSGGELRRALCTCEDGIIVISGPVPDCPPDALVQDFGACFLILLIGRPDVIAACESSEVFRLTLPCAGSAVAGAVEMLSQLHAMRLPKRTGEERQMVEQAKELLMAREGITEPEAHRAMQQYAMRHGMKMADYARQIIQTSMRTEE